MHLVRIIPGPLLVFLLLAGIAAPSTIGQTVEGRELVVGIKSAPPFSMKEAQGSWTGLSVELLHELAVANGHTLRFEEADLPTILEGVRTSKFDVGVSALTITPEREQDFDFTHAYMDSGLAIAVKENSEASWSAVLTRFLSGHFLRAIAALAGLLLLVGFLIWFFERRGNEDEFEKKPRGILSGFWFAAVTMTTVGYGDKAPKTAGGRIVALFWMFASIIIISGVTAAIAAALTVSHLDNPIQGPQDLRRFEVATVAESSGATWLASRGIGRRTERDLASALSLLDEGQVDCVVYDAPILQHQIANSFPGKMMVLPSRFAPQRYALALPPQSDLRESFNRTLLARMSAPGWDERLRRYSLIQ